MTRRDGGDMQYTIVGAGAIGGSLAVLLSREGVDVLLVDRVAEHVEEIRTNGLRLLDDGTESRVRLPAVRPAELDGPVECVLLAVKSQDTVEAIREILPHIGPDTVVVSLQNGLNEYELSDMLGPEKVMGALVNWGADYIEPGVIQFGGVSNFLIGELDGSLSPRLRSVVSGLTSAIPVRTTTNILGFLWSKQINLAAMFASGITHDTIPEVFRNRHLVPFFTRLVDEGLHMADLLGVTLETLDDFDPSLYRAGDVGGALEVTASHYDSMIKKHTGLYRDLAVRRRKSEAGGTIGATIRAAEREGVDLPAHQALLRYITEVEDGVREISLDNLYELQDEVG